MTHRNDIPEKARDHQPGLGEQAGEGVGGIGGTLTGAAIGSAAGPLGAIIGGIAGAVGGWWAGEKAGRAAEDFNEHEAYYEQHFRNSNEAAGLDWNGARLGYGVGHTAGRNPNYRGRSFDDIESDIRGGWKATNRDRYYDAMRPYIRHSYERTSKMDWSDL